MEHIILIHPHSARFQGVADADGGVEAGGVDGGGEAVGGRVAEADGVVFGFEFRDGADGAEDFFLHYFHVFGYVGEDGWLDEEALLAVALAADFDGGAFFFAGVDVAANQLVFVRSKVWIWFR